MQSQSWWKQMVFPRSCSWSFKEIQLFLKHSAKFIHRFWWMVFELELRSTDWDLLSTQPQHEWKIPTIFNFISILVMLMSFLFLNCSTVSIFWKYSCFKDWKFVIVKISFLSDYASLVFVFSTSINFNNIWSFCTPSWL